MKPTRLTQPYRAGAREPGPALDAMQRGRTAGGWNPQDVLRGAMKATGKPAAGRAVRGPRKPRSPRSGR